MVRIEVMRSGHRHSDHTATVTVTPKNPLPHHPAVKTFQPSRLHTDAELLLAPAERLTARPNMGVTNR
jgi:hypothetical protein